MIHYHEFRTHARLFDLDTQRHVTSRTYEAFCWEGRHRLLEELGYPLSQLFEGGLRLNPLKTHCAFSREQHPGNELIVRTWMEPVGNRQHWYQEVAESDRKRACSIATVTELIENGEAISLSYSDALAGMVDSFSSAQALPESVASPSDYSASLPSGFQPPSRASTIETAITAAYCDRSPFFDYPPEAFWRMIEEGRWGFSHGVGLDEKKIREVDTVTFFTSGTFEIYGQPQPGERLIVHTWVHRIEKIRCFLRNDIKDEAGKIICSNIEEQLVVSLSRRRPRKAPPEFIEMVTAYLENVPATKEGES